MDKVSIDQEAHPYVLEANSTFDLSALQLPSAGTVTNRSVAISTASCKQTLANWY